MGLVTLETGDDTEKVKCHVEKTWPSWRETYNFCFYPGHLALSNHSA